MSELTSSVGEILRLLPMKRSSTPTRLPVVIAIAWLSVWSAGCGESSKGRAPVAHNTLAGQTSSTAGAAGRARHIVEDDEHIDAYGRDAAGAERQQIVDLVKRYYAAIVAGEGATACSLLIPALASSAAEDYGQAPGPPGLRGKTCRVVLSKLSRNVSGQPPAALKAVKVTGVRVRGDRGFVQLSSPAMPTGEIGIEHLGASWRLEALIGRACMDCAAD